MCVSNVYTCAGRKSKWAEFQSKVLEPNPTFLLSGRMFNLMTRNVTALRYLTIIIYSTRIFSTDRRYTRLKLFKPIRRTIYNFSFSLYMMHYAVLKSRLTSRQNGVPAFENEHGNIPDMYFEKFYSNKSSSFQEKLIDQSFS